MDCTVYKKKFSDITSNNIERNTKNIQQPHEYNRHHLDISTGTKLLQLRDIKPSKSTVFKKYIQVIISNYSRKQENMKNHVLKQTGFS